MDSTLGSKDGDWLRDDAGNCWAQTIKNTLLAKSKTPNELNAKKKDEAEIVVMSLGGGHYVPFINDIISNSETVCAQFFLQENN